MCAGLGMHLTRGAAWRRACGAVASASLHQGGGRWACAPAALRKTARAAQGLARRCATPLAAPLERRPFGATPAPGHCRQVDGREEIPPGSEEEVEIRAAMIVAVERLRAAVERRAAEARARPASATAAAAACDGGGGRGSSNAVMAGAAGAAPVEHAPPNVASSASCSGDASSSGTPGAGGAPAAGAGPESGGDTAGGAGDAAPAGEAGGREQPPGLPSRAAWACGDAVGMPAAPLPAPGAAPLAPGDGDTPPLLAIHVDWWLWGEGEKQRAVHPPHHRTRTVNY